MKIKKLLILICICFITGCSANYDLYINNDSTIMEKAKIEIDDVDDNYDKLFKSNNISEKEYKVVRNDDSIEITYNKKYENIESYILDSILYKQVFSDIDIDKTYSKTKLSTTANFNNSNISINKDNDLNFDYLQVNIDSKLPIISENSDSKNENAYTWIYNGKQKEKNISITYKNSSSILTYRSILLILLIIICSLAIALLIYNRFKERQKF